ncbi:MAG: alpha/beta fold hydrolase [Nitrospinota bacterium]
MTTFRAESVLDIGDGHPLVMLHGWGQTKKALYPLAKSLSSKFRTILLDLPGHGELKSDQGPYSYSRYCNIVKEVVTEKIKGGPFTLLGWSMGGAIAALYALKKVGPSPASLIFLSATAKFAVDSKEESDMGQPKATLKKTLKLLNEDHEFGLRSFVGMLLASNEKVDDESRKWVETHLVDEANFPPPKKVLIDTLNELIKTDLTLLVSDNEKMSTPLLLAHGEIDNVTPIKSQLYWYKLFKNIVKFNIKNVGHAPQLTALNKLSLRIEKFLTTGN